MLQEYQEALEKQTKEQNIKLDEQNIKFDQKFDKQNVKIDQILKYLKSNLNNNHSKK